MLRRQAFDVGERQESARRRVRIGDDDAAVILPIVVDADVKGIAEWDGAVLDAVKATIDRIEAVADVRHQHRPSVAEQAHEDVSEHLVGTVADEDMCRADVAVGEVRGDGRSQMVCVGVGIQAQAGSIAAELGLDRLDDARRRRVRIFVGVELDEVGELGLLAGNIRRQLMNERAPELAHGDPGSGGVYGGFGALQA